MQVSSLSDKPNKSNNNDEEDNESSAADLSIVVQPASSSRHGSEAGTMIPASGSHKASSSSFLVGDSNAVSELQEALSRRNSFINYFDNKLNMPDVTVPNLLDAVNYIIQSIKK